MPREWENGMSPVGGDCQSRGCQSQWMIDLMIADCDHSPVVPHRSDGAY